MKPATIKKPRARVSWCIATIKLSCPCGGDCVSPADGSYLLFPNEDTHGKCDQCGKLVKIPKAATH